MPLPMPAGGVRMRGCELVLQGVEGVGLPEGQLGAAPRTARRHALDARYARSWKHDSEESNGCFLWFLVRPSVEKCQPVSTRDY